jgi:hypothetical protein
MYYLAKQDGRVYCHKSLEGLKRFGVTKADRQIDDAEFEAAGCIARLVGGEIFIGPTDEELQSGQRQDRASEIERRLREIDAKSDRPARAVALAAAQGNAPDTIDIERLEELETEAQSLRAELQGL